MQPWAKSESMIYDWSSSVGIPEISVMFVDSYQIMIDWKFYQIKIIRLFKVENCQAMPTEKLIHETLCLNVVRS